MEIDMRICYFKNLFLYAFRFLTDCNLGNHFHIIIGLNSSTAWKYYIGNDVYSGDRFAETTTLADQKPLTTQFYLLLAESPL